MIDLLKADFYRLRRWDIFYLWLFLLTGADLLCEAVKRIVLKRQITFLRMMVSGVEQKVLFVFVGIFVILYLYQERESGFLRQTQPLYPKWKQIAEKLVFAAGISLFFELFFFGEHFAKVIYLKAVWSVGELIEAEAFFIGNTFLCTAFATVGICLIEWLRNVWGAVIVLAVFVYGLPLYVIFQKMLEVTGGEKILQYGMRMSFLSFCQEVNEITFLKVILISCIWIAGFGGFALLGRMRR